MVMYIEIITKVNLHKEVKGGSKLIKKNVKVKQYIDTEDIKNPSEVLDSKGNVIKGKCSVKIKDIGEIWTIIK
jgi:hypothetical protein